MRQPLDLTQLAQSEPQTALAAQVLWLLGVVDEDQAHNLHVPAGDPVQNSLAIILQMGVHVLSISPLNPRRLISNEGVDHLVDVWRMLHVPEDSICQRLARQQVSDMYPTMTKRIAVTAAYHMNFSHEERTGTVVDLHSALEAGKIVGFQPRGLDGLWLLLPGQGTVECWMYSVGTGELTPTTFEWAQFYALPLYSVFSTAP